MPLPLTTWHLLVLVQLLGMALATLLLWHLVVNAVGCMRPDPSRGFTPTAADYALGVVFLIAALVLAVVWPLGLFVRLWAGGHVQ